MVTRPHWSYSQLNQYLRCPLQFYFERVARLPRSFLNSNLVLGSAVHKALAEYHQRLREQRPVANDDLKQTFLASWQQSQRELPIHFERDDTEKDVVELGVALLERYLSEPPPENILGVELELLVPLHNSRGEYLEKPLVAVLDLLRRNEHGLIVVEFKTSGRRYSEFQAATSIQASTYAHAVQERFGEQATVRYAVLVKTKTPQVQYLDTIRNDADFGRLGDLVQSVDLAIEAGAFYPIENPLNCSGCPFRTPCRQWSGVNKPFIHRDTRELTRETAAC